MSGSSPPISAYLSAQRLLSQPVGDGYLLRDISDRHALWDLRRRSADIFAAFISSMGRRDGDISARNRGSCIYECSKDLHFIEEVNPHDGSIHYHYRYAIRCHNRFCAICMYIRARLWCFKFLSILPDVLASYPHARWVNLTLTVKNPHVDYLRDTLKIMNTGWRKVLRNKKLSYSLLGWIRSAEVTKGLDGAMNVHPHFHILLLVSSTYFNGDYYFSQKDWQDLWRRSAGLDYDPVVDVRAVKPKFDKDLDSYEVPAGVDALSWASAISGALEVLKYNIKPEDLEPDCSGDPRLEGVSITLIK